MAVTSPAPAEPEKSQPPKGSRAGRNLPVAITSGVVLAAAIILSLAIWPPSFIWLPRCWGRDRAMPTP